MRATNLDAKSAIPDNSTYQEWHSMDNVTGYVALRISAQSYVVLLVWPNLGTPFGEQVAHAMRSG